jgi:hypothetical protein
MSNHIPPPGYGVAGVEYDPHGATVTGGVYSEEDASYDRYVSGYDDDYVGQEIVGSSSSEMSTIAKLGIVVGGAVAIYLIFRMSEGAKPVAKKLGGMAEKILSARMGDAASSMFGSGSSSAGRGLKPKKVKMYATPVSARMVKT